MFIASKYEDIYPLRMKTIDERIAQKKIPIEQIKNLELDILQALQYEIEAPTTLDFLKQLLLDVLGIQIVSRQETKKKEDFCLENKPEHIEEELRLKAKSNFNRFEELDPQSPESKWRTLANARKLSSEDKIENYLIEKMCIYLAKMAMHDENLSQQKPSLLAVSSIYVALKICEQLKKKNYLNQKIMIRLVTISKLDQSDILTTS